MPSPLIAQLTARHGWPTVDLAGLDAFLAAHTDVWLFFTENPLQFPESNDVAVVLPELQRIFGPRMALALVHREAEHTLHTRYPFDGWPALVHLRAGRFVGAISRMQDWDIYLREVERLLATPPSTRPIFRVPVVSVPAGGCH